MELFVLFGNTYVEDVYLRARGAVDVDDRLRLRRRRREWMAGPASGRVLGGFRLCTIGFG